MILVRTYKYSINSIFYDKDNIFLHPCCEKYYLEYLGLDIYYYIIAIYKTNSPLKPDLDLGYIIRSI